MNLAEQVKIPVAGDAARMLNRLIAAQFALPFFICAGEPQRLAGKQKGEKRHTDNQRQNKCLPGKIVLAYPAG